MSSKRVHDAGGNDEAIRIKAMLPLVYKSSRDGTFLLRSSYKARRGEGQGKQINAYGYPSLPYHGYLGVSLPS